jgi:gluconolactonase
MPSLAASAPAASGSVAASLASDPPVVVPTPPQEGVRGRPDSIVDLTRDETAALVGAQWRYHDASIVKAPGHAPGPDLKPSGAPNITLDYEPKAAAADFDDEKWPPVAAHDLWQRRGGGKVCFGWYRTKVTLPARVGDVDVQGATIVFEVVVDDYAEVWVDGELARQLGQSGGPVIKGFNAPNRVVLTHDGKPGQTFSIAVFGINGPISASPENFLWIKDATLDVYRRPKPTDTRASLGWIERKDPGLDAIAPPGTSVEKVATGFQFTEGPVWDRATDTLLFSDPSANTIYRYTPDGIVSIFLPHSGYAGLDIGRYHQAGSNGLTMDKQGRLTINQHGNRRVVRLEANGQMTLLADKYEDKRFNSPNDLVYKSDGALYFTDPPFGLPKVFDDPGKELPYSGVFRVKDGQVTLLTKDFTGPNGLAFSPDERYLYVDDWDPKAKVVNRYPVLDDGTLGHGEVFMDMTSYPGDEALDGMKVDQTGNLYVTCPDGVRILSPSGTHLGTVHVAETPHNLAWGDDGQTLYMCALTSVYRVHLGIPGIRP